MFRAVCRQYWPLPTFLTGKRGETYNDRALGCFLSPNHVLTARHFVDAQAKRGRTVIVFRWDGNYEAVPAWDDVDADLVLLNLGDQLSGRAELIPQPSWFPSNIGTVSFEHGLQVGYVGHLRRDAFLRLERFAVECTMRPTEAGHGSLVTGPEGAGCGGV
jgi:hypothetical protein